MLPFQQLACVCQVIFVNQHFRFIDVILPKYSKIVLIKKVTHWSTVILEQAASNWTCNIEFLFAHRAFLLYGAGDRNNKLVILNQTT